MERESFDRLSRLIGSARSRRDAVRLVAVAAVLGGASIGAAEAKQRRGRGRVRSQQADEVPAICLIGGGTGCSKPQGNCANKKIGPGTNLTNCNFVNESGDLIQTNFGSANLTGACFLAATLFNQPNFRGANVSNVCFFETDLSFSDFRGANVRGASFCAADLTGVNFKGSNVTAAQLGCAAKVSCSTILPNGKPAIACPTGQTCCIDICADLQTDPNNCGTCGNVCTPPQTCEQGGCGVG